MNPERRAIKRVSKFGLLAAVPITAIAAVCSTPEKNQPQNLAGGNEIEPTRAAQIPSLPSAEPTLAPVVQSEPTVTVDELYESAHMLALRSPQVANIETLMGSAKDKHQKDPNDPEIARNIATSVDVMMANDEVCNDPQAGISALAKGFTQEAINYLEETTPSSIDHINENNACLEENSQASHESEQPQDLGYEIQPSKYENHIKIVEPDRQYDLFNSIDLKQFQANEVTNMMFRNFPLGNIESEFKSLQDDDPELISKVAKLATDMSNLYDYQTCQKYPALTRFNKELATLAFHKDPNNWKNNKSAFLDSNCIWGQYN